MSNEIKLNKIRSKILEQITIYQKERKKERKKEREKEDGRKKERIEERKKERDFHGYKRDADFISLETMSTIKIM